MNDHIRSALTGGLGVFSVTALIVLLVATELFTFGRGRIGGRTRTALTVAGAVLLALVVTQAVVRF